MIKKVALIMFIPIFIILYIASQNGSKIMGGIGILLFLIISLSQIFIKK